MKTRLSLLLALCVGCSSAGTDDLGTGNDQNVQPVAGTPVTPVTPPPAPTNNVDWVKLEADAKAAFKTYSNADIALKRGEWRREIQRTDIRNSDREFMKVTDFLASVEQERRKKFGEWPIKAYVSEEFKSDTNEALIAKIDEGNVYLKKMDTSTVAFTAEDKKWIGIIRWVVGLEKNELIARGAFVVPPPYEVSQATLDKL
ncbi:MAG: hypothetical protein KC417_00665 [Myxococcales bacterium]|nr:hypothetical protein [Myxococcales bacterium]